MALVQKDLFNSPYAGVFCATNDNLTLVPPGIPKDDMEAVSYTHLTLPTILLV